MTTQSQQVGSPPTALAAATTISIDASNTSSSKLDKKPFEMNTYIQLEMDTNNCNCVPRVCKFCITKLSLQTELIVSME